MNPADIIELYHCLLDRGELPDTMVEAAKRLAKQYEDEGRGRETAAILTLVIERAFTGLGRAVAMLQNETPEMEAIARSAALMYWIHRFATTSTPEQ